MTEGKKVEQQIAKQFEDSGFTIIGNGHKQQHYEYDGHSFVVVLQHIFYSELDKLHTQLTGKRSRSLMDMQIFTPNHPSGIAVEIKHQSVGGTADQKLFYFLKFLRDCEAPTVALIAVGGGFQDKILTWLKHNARHELNHKNFTFMQTHAEVADWIVDLLTHNVVEKEYKFKPTEFNF